MNKQELDKQIESINHESVSDQEKARRINQLNTFYANNQTRIANDATARQVNDESRLKDTLKASYMATPGTKVEDFERDYSTIKSNYLINETLKKDERAKNVMARAFKETY